MTRDPHPPVPPAAGIFHGTVHVLPVRVYYEDTDLSGIVYHANYLRFLERGRSEFLRAAGIHHMAMLDGPDPYAWTLRRIGIEYLRPARVDDALEVHTRFAEMSGARMIAVQAIRKGGHDLVTARVEACIIGLDGRLKRIPAPFRAALAPFLVPDV